MFNSWHKEEEASYHCFQQTATNGETDIHNVTVNVTVVITVVITDGLFAIIYLLSWRKAVALSLSAQLKCSYRHLFRCFIAGGQSLLYFLFLNYWSCCGWTITRPDPSLTCQQFVAWTSSVLNRDNKKTSAEDD